MEEQIKLRLKWTLTWPDRNRPKDFSCEAPECLYVGRIYEVEHGPSASEWFWAFQASAISMSRTSKQMAGREPTAREAAKRIEDIWFELGVPAAQLKSNREK